MDPGVVVRNPDTTLQTVSPLDRFLSPGWTTECFGFYLQEGLADSDLVGMCQNKENRDLGETNEEKEQELR